MIDESLKKLAARYFADEEVAYLSSALKDRLMDLESGNAQPHIVPAVVDAMFPLVNGRKSALPVQPELRLTHKQNRAVEAGTRSPVFLLLRALAGTGKTEILANIAKRRAGRGLYLAYNRDVADHASRRLPLTVSTKTCHALAHAAMGAAIKASGKTIENPTLRQLVDLLGLKGPTAYRVAHIVRQAVEGFAVTVDPEVTAAHFAEIRGDKTMPPQAKLVDYANRAWNAMLDPNAAVNISHDAYLKRWLQRGAEVTADYILFDEAQDATPVTLALAMCQGADLIMAGDPHQAIYQYKGTVDPFGMDTSGSNTITLNETFRFGPAIAEAVNAVLKMKAERHLVQPANDLPGQVFSTDVAFDTFARGRKVTYIARSNADLLDMAIAQAGRYRLHISGGLDQIARSTQSAHALWSGQRARITVPVMRDFQNWPDYAAWVEETKDQEGRQVVSIVDRYRDRLPNLIADLARASHPAADANLLLTTAHSCKGLEFDNVWLSDDFRPVKSVKDDPSAGNIAETNILYVAASRAKSALRINGAIQRLL